MIQIQAKDIAELHSKCASFIKALECNQIDTAYELSKANCDYQQMPIGFSIDIDSPNFDVAKKILDNFIELNRQVITKYCIITP